MTLPRLYVTLPEGLYTMPATGQWPSNAVVVIDRQTGCYRVVTGLASVRRLAPPSVLLIDGTSANDDGPVS